METSRPALEETITLNQAKKLVQCMAHEQSFMFLSAPGVGKSEMVYQAAAESGLPCRSLLGTQIAPEDVSGIPRLVGERSVFCPPRVLLPERPDPFCLFLDELPACAPDVQKAFYSLLLERRLGEHALPAGTWVVAAGNRAQDRALVRAMSSALVNRVTILHLRVDAAEWQEWARRHAVRADIRSFIEHMPDALLRPVPSEPVPFSTPRAWALLSRALDLAENAGILNRELRRALAFGRVSAEDAAVFCALAEDAIGALRPIEDYMRPAGASAPHRGCALVRPQLRSPACPRWAAIECKAARREPLPAQPGAGAATHHPDRSGRAMGRTRRRSRHARAAQEGDGVVSAVSTIPSASQTLARIAQGLRMVTVPLPHLSGLAAAVRASVDERVPTMGVFASGRLIVNPAFVARLKQNELVFVLAHELLHLALRTHDRAKGSGQLEFNYAHDYIINDILRAELGFTSIPAGGLDMPGARNRSAEEIVLQMRKNADLMPSRSRVFEGEAVTVRRALSRRRRSGPIRGPHGSR